MTVFVLCMFPIVLSLGFWQLSRAHYKEELEDQYFDQLAATSQPPPLSAEGAAFRRVRLSGVYHPSEYVLIDNQTYEGRVGYVVLARFDASDGRRFLINRGWVEAPADRAQLPVVDAPADIVSVDGVVWPDLGELPLQTEVNVPNGWPKRLSDRAFARVAALIPGVAPYEVRLDVGQPGVLVPAPQSHDFKAAMHRGYATQWFGLSIVLGLGYLLYGFRRHV
ncbi:MAG: SURF1 family protein [Pseudomonadales bacterium]